MRHLSYALTAIPLLLTSALAQTGQPARAPLRPDLAAAAHHLMEHPHPYQMSEEVARERLKKSGFANTQILKPVGNAFETTITQGDVHKSLRIDRLNGKIEELPQ